MKKIKVLFTIGNLDIGGAEKLILNQVKNIDKSKFEPHLCTLFPYGKNNYNHILKELTDVYYHPIFFRGFWDIVSWVKVYKLLHLEKFDLFCCHLFESNFIIRLVNLVTGSRPVFIFEHNVYWKKQWWKILFDKVLITHTAKIFVDSNAILDFTSKQEKIDRKLFAILPYPIELQDDRVFDKEEIKQNLGIPSKSFILSSVGRFVEQKGQTYLIQAIDKILQHMHRDDIYFLIVGYGNMEESLRTLARGLKFSSRVIITSARDIKEILAVSDVFVISSLWEGQPIAMLEAMSAGCAVVATNVGGIPEIIVNEENGLLSMPKDPDSLASQIIRVINEDSLREKMSHNARLVVYEYSLGVYIKKLEAYFTQSYESTHTH